MAKGGQRTFSPCVAQLRQPTAAALPADLRELWEERAAIMEYDGGLPRAAAERQALRCVLGLPTEGAEALDGSYC